jgi:uncharacterized protein
MCLGCRTHAPKTELIRLVRTKDGTVQIDSTGKNPGRGAYICKDINCFERIRRGKKIDKTFNIPIDGIVYEKLLNYMREGNIADLHECAIIRG